MELSWQVRAWSPGFSPQHHMKLSTRQHVYKVDQDGKTAHGQRHRPSGLTIRVQSLRTNCQFVLWPTHAHFGRSTPIITHTQWINLYFFFKVHHHPQLLREFESNLDYMWLSIWKRTIRNPNTDLDISAKRRGGSTCVVGVKHTATITKEVKLIKATHGDPIYKNKINKCN